MGKVRRLGGMPGGSGSHSLTILAFWVWIVVLLKEKCPKPQILAQRGVVVLEFFGPKFIHLPSMNTKLPTPVAAIASQTVTVPPPCFTVGVKFRGFTVFFFSRLFPGHHSKHVEFASSVNKMF
ncbi:hypothetical protein TNIN_224471 [Trichonephila inaurata madagascariensis]|uniref:Uncharacterized protein n=1 Tax=Trichonephila inaurata madagascariensis TaxID=2747483 RepID=A0A8X7C8N7_9ARAC|nr:hypothetical protein TNIN_224471 [Trichonephila inaurata madagascariensis]